MAAPSATWGECPPMRPMIVGNSRTTPGEQYTRPCRLRVEALCLGSVPLELHTNCVPLSGGDVLICPRAFIWGQVVLKVEIPEFLKFIFPLFWLSWVFVAVQGLRGCARFPLVAVSGPTLPLWCMLLTAVASLAVEHSLQGCGLQWLQRVDSAVIASRL